MPQSRSHVQQWWERRRKLSISPLWPSHRCLSGKSGWTCLIVFVPHTHIGSLWYAGKNLAASLRTIATIVPNPNLRKQGVPVIPVRIWSWNTSKGFCLVIHIIHANACQIRNSLQGKLLLTEGLLLCKLLRERTRLSEGFPGSDPLLVALGNCWPESARMSENLCLEPGFTPESVPIVGALMK